MFKTKRVKSAPRVNDTEILIMRLVKLLDNNWEKDQKISVFLTSIDQENASDMSLDLLHILVNSLFKKNFHRFWWLSIYNTDRH